MNHDMTVQAVAGAVLIGGTAVCGAVLPRLTDTSERHMLRYTDDAVEGAPPIVALGTAIGALRGIVVDYLWIKVHLMKQKGLYYEVMADSDLITKLQPRFAAVWAFHGHNMAYNISVAHNTEAERWEWVKAGINLIRNDGLRYNPNDLQLHRELAFFFMHKLEGYSDDAHLYYKREFAREWHAVLGTPPGLWAERVEWIRAIAEAPATLGEAERRTPGVQALVERLRTELEPFSEWYRFALDRTLLNRYSDWEAISGESTYARIFRFKERTSADNPVFDVFDRIASDEAYADAWATLLAHLRKRVLIDDYNMDPQLMYEYTRDYGPIDWRSGYAHALYWTLKGSAQGEERVAVDEEDVYRIVNNDRLKLQAMQGLARWGRISFDPFSADWVSRLPDPRWIGVVDRYWEQWSLKHQTTRGPAVDIFMAFHQNFLASSVRELWRSGERQLAERYYKRLQDLYGPGNKYLMDDRFFGDIETFVWNEIKEEYETQPHLAPSDVAASLSYAIREGIGRNRPEVFEEAVRFADRVTTYYKTNNYNNFVTKMGSSRLGDMVAALENSVIAVFGQVMTDGTIDMGERVVIWARAPVDLKQRVYDRVLPVFRAQFESHPLSTMMPLEEVLPEPPGMDAFRAAVEAQRQRQEQQKDDRSDVERK